jgi:predicted nucleic acid-binding protein
LAEAQQGLKIFNAIPLRFVRVDLNNAISIAYETKTYAYDAYFLDCAVRHAAPLLTLDRALERAAMKLGVKLMEV